jgi:hypothetical protein
MMAELFSSDISEQHSYKLKEFFGVNHTLTHALTRTQVILALIYERKNT